MTILGAGMVHPVVLHNGGLDPERYQGFAFGIPRSDNASTKSLSWDHIGLLQGLEIYNRSVNFGELG